MAQSAISLYEGLFLLNQQASGADLSACIEDLRQILERAKAEVVVMKKWSDRKLAYEIKGQKRGTFFLVYFRAAHDQIINIDRDCNLSDLVLRNLIIKADHIGETELEVINKDADNLGVEANLRSSLSSPVSAAEVGAAASETATAEA